MTPSRADYTAVVRSPPDTVDDAHDFLQRVWSERPDVSAAERMAMETALSELVTNVIQNNPHREVLCAVTLEIHPELIVLQTADTGVVVDGSPDVASMPCDEAEHGRGLALIRMITDGLSYHHDGERNVWRAQKARAVPDGADG